VPSDTAAMATPPTLAVMTRRFMMPPQEAEPPGVSHHGPNEVNCQ
jgi:hypothetical protein